MATTTVHRTQGNRHEASRLRDALLAELSESDLAAQLAHARAEFEDEWAAGSMVGALKASNRENRIRKRMKA